MPQFDRTGPEGKGSKTGRGLGKCNDAKRTEGDNNWFGWFSGRRQRRRWGNWNRERYPAKDNNE